MKHLLSSALFPKISQDILYIISTNKLAGTREILSMFTFQQTDGSKNYKLLCEEKKNETNR